MKLKRLALLAASLAFPLAASATPSYDTFGPLPAATFGGSGISNANVAISETTANGTSITLGLSATPRFGSPGVTNDGAGTFFAQPGTSAPGLSLWNFDFYVGVGAGPSVNGYFARLSYDVSPLGLNFGTIIVPLATSNTVQDSWNLGMSFLYGPTTLLTPPIGGNTFDPNAPGTYTFTLDLMNGLSVIKTASIDVVVSPVPEPSTYALMAAGLAVFGFMARRRARS